MACSLAARWILVWSLPQAARQSRSLSCHQIIHFAGSHQTASALRLTACSSHRAQLLHGLHTNCTHSRAHLMSWHLITGRCHASDHKCSPLLHTVYKHTVMRSIICWRHRSNFNLILVYLKTTWNPIWPYLLFQILCISFLVLFYNTHAVYMLHVHGTYHLKKKNTFYASFNSLTFIYLFSSFFYLAVFLWDLNTKFSLWHLNVFIYLLLVLIYLFVFLWELYTKFSFIHSFIHFNYYHCCHFLNLNKHKECTTNITIINKLFYIM